AVAAGQIMGHWGTVMMVIGAAVSALGFNAFAGYIVPRYLSPLAEDGHLPRKIAAMHPKHGTPYWAIGITAVVTIAAIWLFNFDQLVVFTNFAIGAQMIATCLSVPFLRRKLKAPSGSFRIPFGYWGCWAAAIIGTTSIIGFLAGDFISNPQ